ncbi:MAG: metallophosphatase family protein [Spirochaetaceae bacterium]|jgi:predicted phosphodiesterase|nr:metallophosphatase family protein [Spirochaetaceae bacterium]
MRILVISDIHANLAAFTAVLRRTREERDLILCLGDMVGYGPDPNECVELAAEVSALILGGNHDLAVGKVITAKDFAPHAKKSLRWTGLVLSAANKAYLSRLQPRLEYPSSGDTPPDVPEPLLLSHGGPEDPIWSYILSEIDAEAAFRQVDFSRCFFGHTHLPSVFVLNTGGTDRGPAHCTGRYGPPDTVVETGRQDARFLLNPGSVGFPRNEDEAPSWDRRFHAVARYALFDLESGLWQFKGIEYDMGDTLERMVKFGLW